MTTNGQGHKKYLMVIESIKRHAWKLISGLTIEQNRSKLLCIYIINLDLFSYRVGCLTIVVTNFISRHRSDVTNVTTAAIGSSSWVRWVNVPSEAQYHLFSDNINIQLLSSPKSFVKPSKVYILIIFLYIDLM